MNYGDIVDKAEPRWCGWWGDVEDISSERKTPSGFKACAGEDDEIVGWFIETQLFTFEAMLTKKGIFFFIYCLMPLLSICYGLFQMVNWWWLLQVPISPGKAGKVEMWLSSPTRKAAERSLVSLNRVGVKRVNPDQDMDLCGNGSELISTGVASGQSPFQTPPSLSYCHDKVILFS